MYETREQYLVALMNELDSAVFKTNGFKMPRKVRVTCGFPSQNPLAQKKRRIGECWPPEWSADGTTEIIISMVLDGSTQDKRIVIAETLAHEMVHAVDGCRNGHKKPFRDIATKIGFAGKMTATKAVPELVKMIKPILKRLGKYPHGELDRSKVKKQTTRNIKLVCYDCSWNCRTARKNIEEVRESGGQLICSNSACGGTMTIS